VAFVAPAVFIFSVFFVFPVISSFYVALTKWDGINPNLTFVGLKNLKTLLADQRFWSSMLITFKYSIAVTLIQNTLGIILALAVSRKIFTPFRVLFLIPPLLSTVAVGNMWSYILNPRGGLNKFLINLGLRSWRQEWLGAKLALYSIMATTIWKWTGMAMIIYLAGLQAIPTGIQEAASIDGVSPWQRFRYITFPLIAPSFTINMVLSLIGSLKVFDIIWIMTGGGPGGATESMTTYIFKLAFDRNRFGYGTMAGVGMFVVILILSIIQMRFLSRREIRG